MSIGGMSVNLINPMALVLDRMVIDYRKTKPSKIQTILGKEIEVKETDTRITLDSRIITIFNSLSDMKQEIISIKKDLIELKPKVKAHKYLKFRNPFYFIKK